jgi:hypothetical protein
MSSENIQLKGEMASLKLDHIFQLSNLKNENNNLKNKNKNLRIQIKKLETRSKATPQKYKIEIDALKYRLMKAKIKRKQERKRFKKSSCIRRISSDENNDK